MPNIALIPEQNTEIDELAAYISGVIDTEYKLDNHVGDEPLEDGANINDHAASTSERIVVNGFVSDLTDERLAAPANCFAKIQQLRRDLQPLTVVTPWVTYDEMIIRSARVREKGLAMTFRLELTKLIRRSIEQNAISNETSSGPAQGRSSTVDRGRVISPPF